MARIRTIKPDFWTDEKIVKLPPEARLLFVGLLNFSDDHGYQPDEPLRIKMQIFPADPFDVPRLIGLLVDSGRVSRVVSSDGRNWLHIVNFTKHQKVNHPQPSRFIPGTFPERSGNVHGTFTPDWNGREGNGRDVAPVSLSLNSNVREERERVQADSDPKTPEEAPPFRRPPSPWDEMVPLTRGKFKEAPLCPECGRRTVWIETKPGERYNNDRWFCPKPPAGCGVAFSALDWEEKDGVLVRKPPKPKAKRAPSETQRFRVSKRYAPEVAEAQPNAPPEEKEDLPF